MLQGSHCRAVREIHSTRYAANTEPTPQALNATSLSCWVKLLLGGRRAKKEVSKPAWADCSTTGRKDLDCSCLTFENQN